MICNCCHKDVEPRDFLPKHACCYKCVYKQKLAKKKGDTVVEKHFCRICHVEVVFDVNAKKRQRSVFCSSSCALIGHKEKTSNHWTRQLRSNFPLFP